MLTESVIGLQIEFYGWSVIAVGSPAIEDGLPRSG